MTQTLDTPTHAPTQRAERWLADFEEALRARGIARAAGMFAATSFWRDLLSFTWNITTVENPDGVAGLLAVTLERTDPTGFTVEEPPDEADGVTTAWFTFETAVGRGRGLLRLIEEDGQTKAWTFLTTLYELKGFEEPRGPARPMGTEHGANKERLTWLERREKEEAELGISVQPDVLVIGGGQGGIALGARLRQLGVPALVVDKHDRPGDQWRGRYKSLCLHDPVWYDHLPYLKFPGNWPVFSPKEKIGDWLESYVRVMEVPYWGGTVATRASYSPARGEWTVEVERHGKSLTLRPKQVVMATGVSGKPNIPVFPGQDVFRSDQQHSSAHPARTPTPARRSSSWAATTLPSTSAARCGSTTPT